MPVIQVEGLGKRYKRYASQWGRFAEALTGGRRVFHTPHWALRGISFQVGEGESVGIVGQNGAGKSTLLKILAGTTQPTEGRFACHGRTAALLELGMGFHPEFTGRQNAVMGCQILGFPAEEIRELLPWIIEFSELGDYIDEPIRTYSSGMHIRLAFSVAAASRPQVLMVDEALSVGDAYFQHKCSARIRAFRNEGTSLLFVSHDPGAVKTLCDRAILLDQGMVVREGPPDAVLDYYNALIAKREHDAEIVAIENQFGRRITRSGNKRAEIADIQMIDGQQRPTRAFRSGEPATIICRVAFNAEVEETTVGIAIRDRLGNEVYGTNTHHLGIAVPRGAPRSLVEVQFSMRLTLGYGNYSLTVAAHTGPTHVENNYDWWDNALAFTVVPGEGPFFTGVCLLKVDCNVRTLASGGNVSAPGA